MIKVKYDNVDNTIMLEEVRLGFFNRRIVIDIEEDLINNRRIWTSDQIEDLSSSGPTSKEFIKATKLSDLLYLGYTPQQFIKAMEFLNKEANFESIVVDPKIIMVLINAASTLDGEQVIEMIQKLDNLLNKN